MQYKATIFIPACDLALIDLIRIKYVTFIWIQDYYKSFRIDSGQLAGQVVSLTFTGQILDIYPTVSWQEPCLLRETICSEQHPCCYQFLSAIDHPMLYQDLVSRDNCTTIISRGHWRVSMWRGNMIQPHETTWICLYHQKRHCVYIQMPSCSQGHESRWIMQI